MARNDGKAQLALGEVVRELRLEAGITQENLAHRLGVPQSMVSNIEGGHRRLGVLEALQICEELGVSLGRLVSEFEGRNNEVR